MYKYLSDGNGGNRTDFIKRLSDGAWIPNDTGNKDWIEYQAWRDEDPNHIPFDPE